MLGIMWKKRLLAVVILLLAAGLGYFVYWSQVSGHTPFKLGLDLSGGTYLTYKADISNVPASDINDAMSSLRDVIERRVNLFGVSEPRVSTETTTLAGDGQQYQLVVELPGVTDVKKAIDMIGQTPNLQFEVQNPDYGTSPNGTVKINSSDIKNGTIDLSAALANASPYKPTALTGQYLSHATLEFDPNTHQPIVGIQFNAEGSKMFEDITAANVGKPVAIYLDGSPISTPTVNQKIVGGQAVITGKFTPVEAKELVGRLNSGALPIPVSLISTSTIGPTLGASAIHAGLLAGLIAIIFVAALLIVWYRLPGLIAIVALGMYAVFMLFLFKIIPVTITSAGIAGLIISLGMAVDANILIFERTKEELIAGKTLEESLHDGFARAWNSIRDGNISSIISAVILYWFGSTLIKGFALTFGLGVLVSMITAFTISRIMLYAVAGSGNGRIKRFLFSSGMHK